jgi:hypothetical protein
VLCLFQRRRLEGLKMNVGYNIIVNIIETGGEDVNSFCMARDRD